MILYLLKFFDRSLFADRRNIGCLPLIDLKGSSLREFAIVKLKVLDQDPIDISPSRKEKLRAQLDTHLKPVLRPEDFEKFYLDRAFELVTEMGSGIQERE